MFCGPFAAHFSTTSRNFPNVHHSPPLTPLAKTTQLCITPIQNITITDEMGLFKSHLLNPFLFLACIHFQILKAPSLFLSPPLSTLLRHSPAELPFPTPQGLVLLLADVPVTRRRGQPAVGPHQPTVVCRHSSACSSVIW